jgi:glutathione S-transferase
MFTPEETWDRADQERAALEIGEHLAVLESLLAGRRYLVDDFSLADVAYAPLVCELEACQLGHLMAAHPAVRDWISTLGARPSVRATSPLPM